MALVVGAVQVHAVPARREEHLSAETEAWLRRKAVVLSRGRLLQAHVGNSQLGKVRAIESSVRRPILVLVVSYHAEAIYLTEG